MQQSWLNRNLGKLIVIPLLTIFGGVSAWLTYDTYSFFKNAHPANGEVVDLVQGRGLGIYHAVVRFTTAKGDSVEFTSTEGRNPPAYGIGERVPVAYLPDDPEDARIGPSKPWLLPLIFWGITFAIAFGAKALGAFKKGSPENNGF